MSPEEERQRGGLTRERLVEAALQLVNEEGLEGLSMRALADQLEVKAASLYWHVRDRRELIELLAESILESVPKPRRAGGWREGVLDASESLRRAVSKQKDADRILLEVPDALHRSDLFRDLARLMREAGLGETEAAGAALMVATYVIAERPPIEVPAAKAGATASIAIDTGSRGVVLRAGPSDMGALFRVAHDQSGAAPAIVQGETVVVRRLRGTGHGEIELNPRYGWKVKVQAPTWNTVLDLAGLDVRGIHVDSGATKVEGFLPAPRGVVPIHISSGVVGVNLHRAREAAVVAIVHTGAVKLKLDQFATQVALFDVHWQSDGAAGAKDRYDLDVSSGVVKFELDTYTPKVQRAAEPDEETTPSGKPVSALEILLDGVESRVRKHT